MTTIFKLVLDAMLAGVMPCFIGFGANPMMGQMKNAANTAGTVASGLGQQATEEGAQLNPFLSEEMKAQHGYTPGQTNELLTAAEGGAGAATGAEEGALVNNAARTGNATGVTKSLDEMARDRSKAAAGASEAIAGQDVMGAKQLNQAGASGMQGLYGTNTGAQLSAMKQGSEDINSAANMDQGWLKPLTGLLGALGSDATGSAGIMKAMQ